MSKIRFQIVLNMRFIRAPKSPGSSEPSSSPGLQSPVIVGLFDGDDIDVETEITDIMETVKYFL